MNDVLSLAVDEPVDGAMWTTRAQECPERFDASYLVRRRVRTATGALAVAAGWATTDDIADTHVDLAHLRRSR